ncbi:MAG TPA: hypothetical protein VG013_38130 [Gemmataceae bacterium]|jgi:hypothetical protein|nr:hypothetical protein [Gemmataceae bacterium]
MMRRALVTPALAFALLLSLAWPGTTWGALPARHSKAQPRTGIAVWDTRQPASQTLAPSELVETNGWTRIPQGKTAASFDGDAVLSNGRVLAVLRKRDSAVEVYAQGPKGPVARARLLIQAPGGEWASRLDSMNLVENTRGAACLEVHWKTAKNGGITAKFRIKRGDVTVQAQPGAGAGRLRVECPSRLVVLPDFFADDITVNAAQAPADAIEVPGENFLLHLTGQGDAIAMCVFDNRQQDVRVTLSGRAGERTVTGSEIGFEGKKIWLALLESPHVWHALEVKAADDGKVVSLDWRMPFPAQWRVDFTRPNGLTDSWEMLLQESKGGPYVKPSWLGQGEDQLGPDRHRWNTVLGDFHYPCWSDPEGRGYLQPLRNDALRFRGPVVLYPINRVRQTPLDAYTVVDVMRNTLGVGPCEHILDVEGQKSEYKGRATCSCREELGKIYGNHEQKEKRAEVEKVLDDGLIFVKHIRGRITRYVDFGHKMHRYLAEQKKTHPELGAFVDEMDQITREIDARVAARADKIQTPAHVAKMNEDFRKHVLDDEGPDALAMCRKYALALVVIGGNQDELSGECRWVVKTLRQRAGMRMALDPKVARIAGEIRSRTQEALRNPASHEGARH